MTYKDIQKQRAQKNNTGKVWGKLTPYQIILAPIFTEKSVDANENLGKYVFKVHLDANKIDIKKAIQLIYWVDVGSVNVMNVPHKWRMMRKTVRKPYKKAVITVRGDKKIELV